MKKIQMFAESFPIKEDIAKIALTKDETFDREAILIDAVNAVNGSISIDLLVRVDKKVFHLARMNFAIPEEGFGRTHIDFCLPDDAEQSVLFWHNGDPEINLRNKSNKDGLLSVIFRPAAPLDGGENA